MIELRNLTKTFAHRIVLRQLNLTINEGDFVTLMGANGVGKTTLLHLVATLSQPTAGNVLISGHDSRRAASQLRRYIGLVSHKPLLYDDLTAAQNLHFYARLYSLSQPDGRIEQLLTQVGLWGRQHDLVRTYSRGMQQRLSIARAMLHNPPILLLDEPDTGLDQQATHRLGELLLSVGLSQRTIVMTTHNLAWGVEMGNRMLILSKGRVGYDSQGEAVTIAQIEQEYYNLQ